MLKKLFLGGEGKKEEQPSGHDNFGSVQELIDTSFDIMDIASQKAMESDDLRKVDDYINDFFAEMDIRTMEVHNAAMLDKNVKLTLDQAVALDDYYHHNQQKAAHFFDQLRTRDDFQMMGDQFEDRFQRAIEKLTLKSMTVKDRLAGADAKAFGARTRHYTAPEGSEYNIGEPS